MTNFSQETDPGTRTSPAEKFARQFGGLINDSVFLYPEGKESYEDPERADQVEKSYDGINGQITDCEAGEPILLIARDVTPTFPGGRLNPCTYKFTRTLALGELAGRTSILYDFRGGEIVFPTKRFVTLFRHSLTAVTKFNSPQLVEGPLGSKKLVQTPGLLPSKEELFDRSISADVTEQHRGFKSAEKYELFDIACAIAVGNESVERLATSLVEHGGKTDRKLFKNDLGILFNELGAH